MLQMKSYVHIILLVIYSVCFISPTTNSKQLELVKREFYSGSYVVSEEKD